MADIVPVQMNDMLEFSAEQIRKAGELLGCQMDKASCIKALIVQQDTGLSMARGEISVVPFKGKPQVFINRQGYLAYANRQEVFDGLESGAEEINGRLTAWCKVYRKDRRIPTTVRILYKEFRKSSPVWEQMPEYMLEKTAMSIALRQAFPVLNGTYSEEERDAPYTITPRDDDIDVTPQPVPEKLEGTKDTKDIKDIKQQEKPDQPPASPKTYTTEPVKKPSRLYSKANVDAVINNMQQQGLEVPAPEFFESAKMPDGTYNADIINDEYTRLLHAKREAAEQKQTKPTPEPSAEFHPSPEMSEKGNAELARLFGKQEAKKAEPAQKVCPQCGKPSMTEDEAKQIECLADTKVFNHDLCKDCADKWNQERIAKLQELDDKMPKCTDCGRRMTEDEARRSIAKYGTPVCPECWIKRYKKE